jgi:hypothetical protein
MGASPSPIDSALPDTSCSYRISTTARSSPTSPTAFATPRKSAFDTIIERGRLAAYNLPDGIVYAEFSRGALPAQMLARTRPGAK